MEKILVVSSVQARNWMSSRPEPRGTPAVRATGDYWLQLVVKTWVLKIVQRGLLYSPRFRGELLLATAVCAINRDATQCTASMSRSGISSPDEFLVLLRQLSAAAKNYRHYAHFTRKKQQKTYRWPQCISQLSSVEWNERLHFCIFTSGMFISSTK